MSATSSDIGSSHQNPRRRPSFVFWDRSRKNSSASAHPPSSDPPQPSQQTSSSLTPSHAAAPQSSMDETQSSASSSPAIMGLDMEVVERERQSMDRQWEETQARLVGSSRIDGLAGLGLGGDDGSEGGRAPELSTQLPVQSFDAFSLPEFTDSSATSDSGPHLSASSFGNSSTPSASGKARGHSQSVSEAGSSTQQRDATSSSSRNPYEHGRGSVGALLQTHEYMQRSSSYQSKSSSSNSRRTSREVSFAVPGPSRSSSKADGRESRQGHHRAAPDRQHPEDGDVPTLEEGADAEEPSEGETFTHDLARSRRRRRLLRNTMRRRSKRKSGVSRGSGSLKLGGEGGHNDGLEWWESSDAISSSEDGNDAGLSEGSLSGRREGSGDVEDVTVTVTPVTPTMSSRNGGRHRSSSRRASSPPDTNRLTASSVKSSPTASSRSYTTSADSSADMYYDAEDQDQDQDPSKMRASEEELRGGDVELQARRKHSSTTGNASKLKITPGLSEPSSSATLRQDALDRASRGSSYSTHSHSSPESALGSSQAGDSTLRSPTTSVSTAPSPISPASPEFGALLSSPPTSRMFVRPSGALRTHRIGALPPARPSPTSPLPSVPASPPSDKPSREERGLPSSARTSLSGAGMASSTAMMQLTSLGDVKGRTRSQSLGQAAEGLQRPGSPLPTAMPQQQTSREAMQRARSSSHVARVDQPSSHTRFQLPDQPQHQRSSYIAGSQSGARGSAPHLLASPMPSGTSLKESGRAYTVPTPAAGTSLGPNGTVRGRPRGATIGALPPSGHSLGGAGRITVPTRARPRSLLCNEMVLPTEQPSEGQGSSSRTREPSVMMTSSTSSPAELVSSSPASIPSGSTTSASASAYTGSSLASAASSGTSISASTLDDSGELRRSVAEAIAGASGGTSEVSSGGIALMGTSSSSGSAGGAVGAGERKGGSGSRSRSGSNASLLQQVQYPPKSHASFVIAVVGHRAAGKSTVIKKGLRQFGLSKPNVLSEKGELGGGGGVRRTRDVVTVSELALIA